MLSKELQKAGLTEKEAKVYLAALELGETTIERISKKSDVKRSTVYLLVESLKEKGMLSMVKKKKKVIFIAEDPRILERQIEERKNAILKAMPELLSITNFIDKKPDIRYYEGHEGVKEVFMNTLNYPEYELAAWFSDAYLNFDEKFFNQIYIPLRVKKKIWSRIILPENKITRKMKEMDGPFFRKTKLIEQNKFDIKVEISLYGKNKIAIMSFEEEIALIIESDKIFHALKCIFEFMWEAIE